MKKEVKKNDGNSFDKIFINYDTIFKISIFIIIISIAASVISVQENINLPDWISLIIFVLAWIGLCLFIYAGIQQWKLILKGKTKFNKKLKKNMSKAALYAVFITIILSFIILAALDLLDIELIPQRMFRIPILILMISYVVLFMYFQKFDILKKIINYNI